MNEWGHKKRGSHSYLPSREGGKYKYQIFIEEEKENNLLVRTRGIAFRACKYWTVERER